ncbi:MAG TPA: alpha/beta fold hydrolase [Ktedonosporobacter sp.]|nr:alpha/beta fold hydrolase [Ktedonosporobacter sp.]
MATIVSMPKWGLAMKTGQIVAWLKRPGESVQQGEPLVQIESEKAVNEVESPITGTMRWLVVQEGESAPVSAPLAVLLAPGEEISDEEVHTLIDSQKQSLQEEKQREERASSRQRTAREAKRSEATPTGGQSGERINASPAARKLAQELGVDLAAVMGTGPRGMIGREDVLRAANGTHTSSEEAEDLVVDVGGIRTHCLIAGPYQAPRVLFVHGLGGSLTTWALNLPAFATRFRICALDLVGAGESDKPASDYSTGVLAAFVARFLDTLGPRWQHVSIVGHSLGGAVALTFAGQHPQRVERLVLVDSAGLGEEIDATMLHLLRSEPTPEHIRAELACFFADLGLIQQPLIEQIQQQRTQPGARTALLATAEAAFGGGRQQIDLREALASCDSPVLAVWGAADRVLPIAHLQEVNHAPHGRVEVFADCAHCPHIERSQEFNQLVMDFLSET